MVNKICKSTLNNTAHLSYSYDNIEKIIDKNAVSNVTPIHIYQYNYYDESIESIVNIR